MMNYLNRLAVMWNDTTSDRFSQEMYGLVMSAVALVACAGVLYVFLAAVEMVRRERAETLRRERRD